MSLKEGREDVFQVEEVGKIRSYLSTFLRERKRERRELGVKEGCLPAAEGEAHEVLCRAFTQLKLCLCELGTKLSTPEKQASSEGVSIYELKQEYDYDDDCAEDSEDDHMGEVDGQEEEEDGDVTLRAGMCSHDFLYCCYTLLLSVRLSLKGMKYL